MRARVRRASVPDDGRAPASFPPHLGAGLRRRLPPLALLGAAAGLPAAGPGDVAPGGGLPPPLGPGAVRLRLHPVRAPLPAGAVRGGAARRLLAAPAGRAHRRRARARQRARHGVRRRRRGHLRLALAVLPHARGVRDGVGQVQGDVAGAHHRGLPTCPAWHEARHPLRRHGLVSLCDLLLTHIVRCQLHSHSW